MEKTFDAALLAAFHAGAARARHADDWTTDKGEYLADRLVIAAGPWAQQVLADIGLPLSVRRIVNVHRVYLRGAVFRKRVC